MGKVIGSCISLLFCIGLGRDTLFAQTQSCWTFIFPLNNSHDYVNPDSVKVDTCHNSTTYSHRFAAKWFRVEFKKGNF